MKINKFLVAFAATASLTFLSCDNEDSSNFKDDTLSITTTSVALEASAEEVESVVDDYVLYGGSYLDFGSAFGKGQHDRAGFFSSCVEMVSETVDDTITITLTFPEDCEDRNGNLISGTITIVKSLSDTDRSRTVTFDGFTINGYVVSGTKICSYTVENANGNPEMSGSVDISIETDEGTITKVGTRMVEITSGGDTDTHSDDEKTITGSHTFTDAEGNTYAVEITIPLIKPADCDYIASGVKQYSDNGEVSTLDYGDGTCDAIATMTDADGTVTEIKLKRKRKGFGH